MSEIRSGGCLCGAVRWQTEGPPNWQGHCHCESCRRNCAAPFTSFFGIDDDKWQWLGAAPAIYASSKGVRRYFCATCGSPVAYAKDSFGPETHFMAAHLDDPSQFHPTCHFHYGEKLPWLNIDDDLQKFPASGEGQI